MSNQNVIFVIFNTKLYVSADWYSTSKQSALIIKKPKHKTSYHPLIIYVIAFRSWKDKCFRWDGIFGDMMLALKARQGRGSSGLEPVQTWPPVTFSSWRLWRTRCTSPAHASDHGPAEAEDWWSVSWPVWGVVKKAVFSIKGRAAKLVAVEVKRFENKKIRI